MAKPNSCTFPFCDGTGNINGTSKKHNTIKNCPNKEKNPSINDFIQLVTLFITTLFITIDILLLFLYLKRTTQAEQSLEEIDILKKEIKSEYTR